MSIDAPVSMIMLMKVLLILTDIVGTIDTDFSTLIIAAAIWIFCPSYNTVQ